MAKLIASQIVENAINRVSFSIPLNSIHQQETIHLTINIGERAVERERKRKRKNKKSKQISKKQVIWIEDHTNNKKRRLYHHRANKKV